ncbi:hypothetical protein JHU38_07925 [Prevotella sp. A2931]|uniref:Lipoprotein n=1 Tax=Prevotella illustrans TaxID=2800387 RepID=A0ABS3M6E1_9BACT|nr:MULTISPECIES: hypothetical protein [Prevotella]MBO1363696.1 hypothetical protein [Prevotella illustrans]PTL26376.1 hypothetical protein C3V39_04520 [Prevotella sp. oral taxon 820]
MTNKINTLHVIIFTTFALISCNHIKNKDFKVNILALTESESVYFIQKVDTIEYKCYIITEDTDKISITVPYSANDFIDDLKRKSKSLSYFPIAQKQKGYRETLQEIKMCINVILNKHSKEKPISIFCNLSDFSDIAIIVSKRLPEKKCKNRSQIEECINHTTLAADLTAILGMYNMSVQSISLDSEAKSIFMNKELFLSNHTTSIMDIPQKILAVPIKIITVVR